MRPVSTRASVTSRPASTSFTSSSQCSPHAPGPALGWREIGREDSGSAVTSSAQGASEFLARGPRVLRRLYLLDAFHLQPAGNNDALSAAPARCTLEPRLGGACADENSHEPKVLQRAWITNRAALLSPGCDHDFLAGTAPRSWKAPRPFLLTGAASAILSISLTLTWPGLLEASWGPSLQATAISAFCERRPFTWHLTEFGPCHVLTLLFPQSCFRLPEVRAQELGQVVSMGIPGTAINSRCNNTGNPCREAQCLPQPVPSRL